MVVNATRFHGGRASTDLGDNGRATAETISGTEQTVATAVTVGATAAIDVVVVNATTVTADPPGFSNPNGVIQKAVPGVYIGRSRVAALCL